MSLSLIGLKTEPGEVLPPPGARFQDTREEQEQAPIPDLAAHVRDCFNRNGEYRINSGIEETMLQ